MFKIHIGPFRKLFKNKWTNPTNYICTLSGALCPYRRKTRCAPRRDRNTSLRPDNAPDSSCGRCAYRSTLRATERTFDVDTDSVILSVGYTPAPIAKKGKHIHIIGDACKVGNLRTVIWQAWDVVMKL